MLNFVLQLNVNFFLKFFVFSHFLTATQVKISNLEQQKIRKDVLGLAGVT